MSFLSLNRVNDYEIGTRKTELRSVKHQILEIQHDDSMRPSEKMRALKELRELATECSSEYHDLCNNVRRNFI